MLKMLFISVVDHDISRYPANWNNFIVSFVVPTGSAPFCRVERSDQQYFWQVE